LLSPLNSKIDEFVVPFYLELLNANFAVHARQSTDSREKIEFEARFCRALRNIQPTDVEALLSDSNWRSQLTAGWYCATKNWNQFKHEIFQALLIDRSGYAAQGLCIALFSFADDESANLLVECLERMLKVDEIAHQNLVMRTLMLLDEKHGIIFAATQKISFENWLTADRARSSSATSFLPLAAGLDYLRMLEKTSDYEYSQSLEKLEAFYRSCSLCNSLMDKSERHCKKCGRIE